MQHRQYSNSFWASSYRHNERLCVCMSVWVASCGAVACAIHAADSSSWQHATAKADTLIASKLPSGHETEHQSHIGATKLAIAERCVVRQDLTDGKLQSMTDTLYPEIEILQPLRAGVGVLCDGVQLFYVALCRWVLSALWHIFVRALPRVRDVRERTGSDCWLGSGDLVTRPEGMRYPHYVLQLDLLHLFLAASWAIAVHITAGTVARCRQCVKRAPRILGLQICLQLWSCSSGNFA